MTKQQKQRKAVALDVIAQIKASTYSAIQGVYTDHEALSNGNVGAELQQVIKKEVTAQQPCEVCALGACFISTVRLYNDFKLTNKVISPYDDGIRSTALKRKVATIFGRREMTVIESCFENGAMSLNKTDSGDFNQTDENGDTSILSRFLGNLLDDERLTFLMEVVLANPRTPLTVQIVKDTLLSFFIEGRYKTERQALGL